MMEYLATEHDLSPHQFNNGLYFKCIKLGCSRIRTSFCFYLQSGMSVITIHFVRLNFLILASPLHYISTITIKRTKQSFKTVSLLDRCIGKKMERET